MFKPKHVGVSELDGDEFVDIFFGKGKDGHEKEPEDFYKEIIDKVSAPRNDSVTYGADLLRRLYPKHSLVMTQDYGLNIFNLPGVITQPLEKTPLITNLYFIPLARRLGSLPGILLDQVVLGGFQVNWNQYDFIVYVIVVPSGFGTVSQSFILHEGSDLPKRQNWAKSRIFVGLLGPEDPARLLLVATGAWGQQLHDEIWVYNQGFWQKDRGLWTEVQKADWKDVILEEDFKKSLQKDVYGFFASEGIYKELAIPWKRGLIMHGPPGNGKTISLKVIMKTCNEKGFNPLYVKSFQNWAGEEAAMADVFNKARQLSPCVIILEDLDSLINDRNRSFFLNQLDGLEGNDGLLIIGTTNHFDRLDPGLSTRPSRFDRKFKFDDPNLEERFLYAQYWQKKLATNTAIDYPDQLVTEIAESTDRFSFAYLKEAFVSSLVKLAGIEDNKPTFATIVKEEIATLRKQLDKTLRDILRAGSGGQPRSFYNNSRTNPVRPPRPTSSNERDIRALLDALSESAPRLDTRLYDYVPRQAEDIRGNRDIQTLLDTLSEHLNGDTQPFRFFDMASARPERRVSADADGEERDYRALFDRMSAERDKDIRLFQLQAPAEGLLPSEASSANWDDLQSSPSNIGVTLPRNAGQPPRPRYTPESEPIGTDLA